MLFLMPNQQIKALNEKAIHNKVLPQQRLDNMPPPMAVRQWQKSWQIYVRSQTGPQSTHLWCSAVAKLQEASVPIA